MNKAKLIEMVAHEITKELVDRGLLIEAGFAAYAKLIGIDEKTPHALQRELQLAFMAGADHLFSSIMSIMDADAEPTTADLRRMDLIHHELEAWRGRLSERVMPSKGRA